VSLDSLDEAENDSVRGKNSFRQAVTGIRNLAAAGFPTYLTLVRSWDEAEDPAMEARVLEFLTGLNVPHPKAKFLPGFLLGELENTARAYHENERVTEQCFENWPITNLQCASSRMATAQGVYVCPILVEDATARMGATLKETLRPYPLRHSACYTCRISGMSCKSD
ncbi:MAG: radical SAM protein, partial [Nitrospinaceae bacterium]